MRKCACGSIKLTAKGLCNKCYLKVYRNNPRNVQRIKEQKARWHQKNKNLYAMKLKREQIHFGGKREAVLERDNYQCTSCGNLKRLLVHHKDGNGRRKKNPNNNIDNLITLCYGCHINIHRNELNTKRRTRKNGFWSKQYPRCTKCGTTERKHNGSGLCKTCHMRVWRAKHKI